MLPVEGGALDYYSCLYGRVRQSVIKVQGIKYFHFLLLSCRLSMAHDIFNEFVWAVYGTRTVFN